MRVGVTVPMSYSDGPGRMPSWPDVLAFATHAEALGLDAVWVCDHLLSGPPGRPPEGIHEGWTMLAALAAVTSRVELGSLVMCGSFRNPGLLAKMAVTADGVAGGRLLLGLGAGWYDPEYDAFGYRTDHRVSRFEEVLEIICPLLRGETVTFAGRYHRMQRAELLPAPARRIPILVAASRPRMLRLAARHADAWNTAWFGLPDGVLRRRVAEFDGALEAEGRDRTAVRRTVGVEVRGPDGRGDDGALGGSAEELAAALVGYESLGFDDAIVGLRPQTERSLEHLVDALRLTRS